jgi:hypothetical protein
VHKANTIDLEHHEEGCALDELNAHRLLEMFDETLTGMLLRSLNLSSILSARFPCSHFFLDSLLLFLS